MKTILILRDRPPMKPMSYAIDHYILSWKESGYDVIDHIGLDNIPSADIVVVHIDLTVIPKEYIDVINTIPNVINGKLFDISRHFYNQNLLARSDHHNGPVIVKTNANHGGLPEHVLKHKGKQRTDLRWTTVEALNPLDYPIFNSIKNVPEGVWENDHLIVEPFIDTRQDGDLFYVHYYVFFGDKAFSGCLSSDKPIIKFSNAISDEEVPLPDEVRQWREDLNIDFGRIDYLKSGEKNYLIDINKTEGGGGLNDKFSEDLSYLASGIEFYLH